MDEGSVFFCHGTVTRLQRNGSSISNDCGFDLIVYHASDSLWISYQGKRKQQDYRKRGKNMRELTDLRIAMQGTLACSGDLNVLADHPRRVLVD